MLVETAYISNPGEERKLRTPAEQQRLAEAICSGVRRLFPQIPPDGTPIRPQRTTQTLASAARHPPARSPAEHPG